MFCLLAEDNFNTNTASTINIPLSLLHSWQLYRPQGLRTTGTTLAALLLRKLRRGTNEQMDKQARKRQFSPRAQTKLLSFQHSSVLRDAEETERETRRQKGS